jgi:hypothetical protein
MKKHNSKTNKVVPSKIEKVSELQTLCREELLCENAYKISEKRRNSEKIYGANSLFIGVKEGSFKKLPRYDRCEETEGRVSTPTFRG